MTSPVFDMPFLLEGWDGPSGRLIRIVDPLGTAIAWFDPDRGGCCAGYAVRTTGVGVLGVDARWRHLVVGSVDCPSGFVWENDAGGAHTGWRLSERDPVSCTLDRIIESRTRIEAWRMTATLADARLSLLLRIQNLGADPFGTSTRLQLVLAVPPKATVVAPDLTGGVKLEDVGPVATFNKDNDESIKLIVTSDIELSRLWTERFDDGSNCSIVYQALTEHRSVLRPGESRRFHVSIGLTPARRQE